MVVNSKRENDVSRIQHRVKQENRGEIFIKPNNEVGENMVLSKGERLNFAKI
jgi:hypothetical protein